MNKPQLQAKVILVGDVGVGKSSIAFQYVQSKFNEQMDSTLGAAYMQKVIQLKQQKQQLIKSIKLKIWDTAGQQKYKALAKLYYKNAQAVLFVYDSTRKNTLINTKNWTNQVQKYSPQHTIFIVVANKIDLFDDDPPQIKQGQEFSKSINAKFFKVSAKINLGIDDLFTQLIEMLIKKQQQLIDSKNNIDNHTILKYQTNTNQKKCCDI